MAQLPSRSRSASAIPEGGTSVFAEVTCPTLGESSTRSSALGVCPELAGERPGVALARGAAGLQEAHTLVGSPCAPGHVRLTALRTAEHRAAGGTRRRRHGGHGDAARSRPAELR